MEGGLASSGSLRHCFVWPVVELKVCQPLLSRGIALGMDDTINVTVPCTSSLCVPHSLFSLPCPSDDDDVFYEIDVV